MLFVPPAASCWEHAPKAGTVALHWASICFVFCATEKRNELWHGSCLLNSSAPVKKKKNLTVFFVKWYCVVLVGQSNISIWNYVPSTLVAYILQNAGCLVGMRGMGPEWKYKCKPYFIFRRENQPVHFGGKGPAWHTWFSSRSIVLVILNKESILFFMRNFLCWIGNALWSYFYFTLLFYFILIWAFKAKLTMYVFSFLVSRRMNFTHSLRPFFRMSVQSPILGSTCRLGNASTLKSTRSECQRMKKEQSKMSFSVKSLKSNRSGRPGSWPNCAKISARSTERTLCSPWLARSTRAVSYPILTRRVRLGESTACDRQTKSGVWI